MWYDFRQNNSGGYFNGPKYVLVEADGYEEANAMAEKVGVYFDGTGDCPRCGPRWSMATEWDDDDPQSGVIWPSDFTGYQANVSFKVVTKETATGELRVQDIETKSTDKFIPWEGV
jgi:hypothetical protein|tara:strand:+ start:697 stop:1044 length:348 start_codon:yes stop_codon:yes gene_type:complete